MSFTFNGHIKFTSTYALWSSKTIETRSIAKTKALLYCCVSNLFAWRLFAAWTNLGEPTRMHELSWHQSCCRYSYKINKFKWSWKNRESKLKIHLLQNVYRHIWVKAFEFQFDLYIFSFPNDGTVVSMNIIIALRMLLSKNTYNVKYDLLNYFLQFTFLSSTSKWFSRYFVVLIRNIIFIFFSKMAAMT